MRRKAIKQLLKDKSLMAMTFMVTTGCILVASWGGGYLLVAILIMLLEAYLLHSYYRRTVKLLKEAEDGKTIGN